MTMKLNERSMAHFAISESPADQTGYLLKRGEWNVAYQRRWFVLKGNLLFYFEEQESKEPVGVVVLEGCTVELCQSSEEFAFMVRFDSPGSRSYILSAESQEDMESWVKALSRANFDYMRLVVRELEKKLELMQKSIVRKRSSRVGIRARTAARVKWDSSRNTDYCNGFFQPEETKLDAHIRDGIGALPPPLPPRRRGALWGDPAASGSSVTPLESPVCPGTTCFMKLHEWYGKEIKELRRKWQEEQRNQAE
ncbi:sesquipedalian-2 [Discoglossus pictus]